VTWTKQPPSKPGWYWFKHQSFSLFVYQVKEVPRSFDDDAMKWREGLYAYAPGSSGEPAIEKSKYGLWWSEPIKLPDEPRSIEQIVRDVMEAIEADDGLFVRFARGADPQSFSSGDLVGPANVLAQAFAEFKDYGVPS